MAYLAYADITDGVVSTFTEAQLSSYFTKTDNHIIDLGQQYDVAEADISDPLPFTLKEYAIAYFCMLVCRDKTGNASVEYVQDDKYYIKYKIYQKLTDELRGTITRQVITGDVDEPADRAGGTVRVYRR